MVQIRKVMPIKYLKERQREYGGGLKLLVCLLSVEVNVPDRFPAAVETTRFKVFALAETATKCTTTIRRWKSEPPTSTVGSRRCWRWVKRFFTASGVRLSEEKVGGNVTSLN